MRYLYISLLVIASLPSLVKGQIITTIAGNGTAGYSGDGGQATAAGINDPREFAFDASGNLYFTEPDYNRVRKIVISTGIITTIAGNGIGGYSGDGGQATAAELNSPLGIAIDGAGNLYISEVYNSRIRKVNASGIISTFAGTGTVGYSGDGGQASAAEINPLGITFDAYGNLYIADGGNHCVRKINTLGIIVTIAGNGTQGFSGDGGQATSANLFNPSSIILDVIGNLYIADYDNMRVRKVNTSGIITTFTGNGTTGYSGDGGQASAAVLNFPSVIDLDTMGNLYIADSGNERIRIINTSGIISTIAGNGTLGFSGDGGQATTAELNFSYGLKLDAIGNLYIADSDNYRIRKVCFNSCSAASIEQFATNNEQVTVYPNPASTSLTLTLSKGNAFQHSANPQENENDELKGTCSISIYDMLGKLVMQHAYSPPSEGQGEVIDVSGLSEGVYNILIENSEFKSNKRLVIVR